MRRRLAALGAAAMAVGAVAFACRPVPAPTDGVLSVSEVLLPSPAVVAGDTMRDSAGNVAPLRMYAFGSGGQADTLTNLTPTFILLDSGAHVTPDGYLIGDSVRQAPVRIIGSIGPLQTPVANVDVIPMPDSLAPSGTTTVATDTFSLKNPSSLLSPTVTAQVLSAATPPAGIRSVIVRWAIVSQPPSSDTSASGIVVSTSNHPVTVDTTGADGTVSVRVRLNPAALSGVTGLDSFVVEARAAYAGVQLHGSPLKFVVPIVPGSD